MTGNAERTEVVAHRPADSFTEGRRLALEQLAEARGLAHERGTDPCEFAIELSHLLATGLKVNDLRWLSIEGYVEHVVEVSQPEDTTRRLPATAGTSAFPRGPVSWRPRWASAQRNRWPRAGCRPPRP